MPATATRFTPMKAPQNMAPSLHNNVVNPAKLIVGPAGHCGWSAVKSQTGFDITVEERRFFDYWLNPDYS